MYAKSVISSLLMTKYPWYVDLHYKTPCDFWIKKYLWNFFFNEKLLLNPSWI